MVDKVKSIKGAGAGARSGAGKERGLMLRAASALLDRLQLASMAGLRFDGKRDFYGIFGYKKSLTDDDLHSKYQRQDIAARIVDAPPKATWTNPPMLEGPEGLVSTWGKLTKDNGLRLWNAMYRADKLARLGPYSLLMFGLDGNPSSPATRSTALHYARPISSRMVSKIEFDTNTTSPRFGKPTMYELNFNKPSAVEMGNVVSTIVPDLNAIRVHYTRVLHIVEDPLENDISGIPILEKIFNLLDDLLKVSGGTSETYWLTANRGIQADIDKEMEINPEDGEALADEIEEYQHQLRRIIRTRGVELNVLESTTPNPRNTFEMIMSLISGATGIPRRILLGSELGQLASEQDRANWAERIDERRALFAGPSIFIPTIKTLQQVGVLPEGEFEVEWPSAFILSPLEEGQTMAQIARAVGNLSRQTGNNSPMQITTREEARAIIGLEGDLSEEEILTPDPVDAGTSVPPNTDPTEDPVPPTQE
jgi:hypothetical protein